MSIPKSLKEKFRGKIKRKVMGENLKRLHFFICFSVFFYEKLYYYMHSLQTENSTNSLKEARLIW